LVYNYKIWQNEAESWSDHEYKWFTQVSNRWERDQNFVHPARLIHLVLRHSQVDDLASPEEG